MSCLPSTNFVYPCKLCRYVKCLKVGMSRDAIRHGPYTIVRKLKNKLLVAEIEKRKLASPNALPYMDADDFLILGSSTFHEIRNLLWPTKIENFDTVFDEATKVLESGLFHHHVYMDVFETLGFTLDNRKIISTLIEKMLKIVFTQLICFMMKLPGLNELDPIDFIENLIRNYDIICLVIIVLSQSSWDNQKFFINVHGKSLALTWEDVSYLHGDVFKKFLKVLATSVHPLNFSIEEIYYVFSIYLLADNKRFPKLQTGYNRIVLSFTRYLENTYGKDYHTRISKIVNYVGSLKEVVHWAKKSEKNEKYLKHLYESEFFVSLWFNDIDKQNNFAMSEIQKNCQDFANLLYRKNKIYK